MITETNILDAAKDYFLTYASEVLTDRAIPAAEDGLLPVQRKILWTMEEILKMDSKSKTKKSASIVGSTLAAAYTHGDQACYGAACKMAQAYLMRYPLITGQGSLGSQEANGLQASSRYTEVKPSTFTDIMFNDYSKNVIPTKPTYNDEHMEPVVLPSLFPNALVNGRETVGLAISHNSLPHNLSEVCDAIIAYINGEVRTTQDVLKYIPGPDFPLGGTVINIKDVAAAFETGQSLISLKIRGDYVIEGQKIIFTSIPYRTYRNKIKEQLNKNIDELEKVLADFDDESAIGQNRLVFTIKKGIKPEVAINKLFALTDLESSVSYNMNFIVNGTPKLCSMLSLIQLYVDHQERVLINATQYDKDKAEARAHVIEGLILAIGQIDEVIETIKKATDKATAAKQLIKLLGIDETQANAILDMKLSRLTKLDTKDMQTELKEKKALIKECSKILSDKKYRYQKLSAQTQALKEKYGDARRTKLENLEITKEEKEVKEVTPENVVVIFTESGNIKSIPANSFKPQNRNTKGTNIQADDVAKCVIKTNTVDGLLAFSSTGKVYRIVVDTIPTGTNTSAGVAINTLIPLAENETIQVIYSMSIGTPHKYLLFVTADGYIKKVALDEFNGVRKKTGTAAIKLRAHDELAAVSLMNDEDILIISHDGQCIHIGSDFGAMSRASSGVIGMRLNDGDYVVSALPIRDSSDNLAIFLEGGTGKRIELKELTKQNRGGKGIRIIPKGKTVSTALLANSQDKILVMGKIRQLCIDSASLPLTGRTSAGNIVIKQDSISSASKV